MTTTPTITEDPLNALLDGTAAELDIPQSLQEAAVSRYGNAAGWLAAVGDANGGAEWHMYPQGSFALGTVVRPVAEDAEYDIDMVCLRDIKKISTTQSLLKADVGHALARFVAEGPVEDGPTRCSEGRRCWTLEYPGQGFHLDVLPALRDDEAESDSAILLPDQRLWDWQHSDPMAFAAWFAQRSQQLLLLKEARARIDDVPLWTQRTVLQRAVQVFKRHRDLYFKDDPEDSPPSVLITTAAALGYDGGQSLFQAVIDIASTIGELVTMTDGRWVLENPVAHEENFCDKWKEHPERAHRFFRWVDQLGRDVEQARGSSLVKAAKQWQMVFGEQAVTKAAERIGGHYRSLQEEGLLTAAGGAVTLGTQHGTRVRDHTFYGGRESR